LGTARSGSLPELRRHANRVRSSAAGADRDRNQRAHRNRRLNTGTDPDTGEGWLHGRGPAAAIAELNSLLAPWLQAEFERARSDGRREPTSAYRFDALMAMARAAATGAGTAPNPKATILARVDATAMARGHTVAGETCEIDGLGPVPVDALRDLLPDAAISLIVTNGIDVFNVTNLSRRANARQQVVLDWIGGHCTRLGCPATRNLQVDHRIDWARVKLTELKALDWMCTHDHRLKTHHGWALVTGTGRRPMVPPGHPDHPDHPGQAAAADAA
jgi:hypothetical protein